jgi:hypothetical protein
MIRNLPVAIALLGISLAAYGEPRIISRGYELTLADFSPPATENSGVTFKPCPDCEFISTRVAPATRYTLDGRSVQLAQLRAELLDVRNQESVLITVLRHLESNTIVSVSVTRPQ